MSSVKSFRDLVVWQRSMRLAAEAYRLGALMPKVEQFRLTNQLLRAAAFIPANIAEGHARGTRKDDAHFVTIARGSLAETETFVPLCVDVGILPRKQTETIVNLASEVGRLLSTLRDRLREPAET